MPGGSVNGRPFRESSDSYEKTGIPCGNPKRFRSHEVVRMEPGKRTASSRIDGPMEEIETAGQRHLQDLLRKQLDSKIPLQRYIHQKKEFSTGAEYNPVSKDTSGMITLDDYKVLEKTDGYIEELKSCGLTTEEMLLKLQTEEGPTAAKKGKFTNTEHEKRRLLEIDRKIEEKKAGLDKPDTFSNVKKLSRHDMDLEKTISAGSQSNAFLHKVLIQERDSPVGTSTHVMSQLPEILASVSNSEPTKHSSKKKSRRKHKRDMYKAECTLECCASEEFQKNEIDNSSNHDNSKSDVDDLASIPTCAERPEGYVSQCDQETNKACKQNRHGTSKTKDKKSSSFCVLIGNKTRSEHLQPETSTSFGSNYQITTKAHPDTGSDMQTNSELSLDQSENKLSQENTSTSCTEDDIRTLDTIEGIPREAIIQHRLSLEEVKKLPRFENYDPGEPSNVLYVKNLSPKLTEEELAALFINFQHNDTGRIVFKLLTGRMKGQAFVTFPEISTAREALQLVHGYQYKGKPVIIQYRKKTKS